MVFPGGTRRSTADAVERVWIILACYTWQEAFAQNSGKYKTRTCRQSGLCSGVVSSLYLIPWTFELVFFPPNTWPCLLATANYLQGTCNRLVFLLTCPLLTHQNGRNFLCKGWWICLTHQRSINLCTENSCHFGVSREGTAEQGEGAEMVAHQNISNKLETETSLNAHGPMTHKRREAYRKLLTDFGA